jgi:ParB family chromosome partitioning protein
VIVKDITGEEALAIGLIENIQREDLNPLEEALALQRLAEEFVMTHQEIADTVGRSRVAVSNLIRLLSLESDVKKLIENGDLEMAHGRTLLSLSGAQQSFAARHIAAKGLTVRDTEAYVRQLLESRKSGALVTPPEKIDPNVLRLQNDLADRLGARVVVKQGSGRKGRLVIHYNNLDELEGILAHIV